MELAVSSTMGSQLEQEPRSKKKNGGEKRMGEVKKEGKSHEGSRPDGIWIVERERRGKKGGK